MRRYVLPLVVLLALLIPSGASANGDSRGKIARDCNQTDAPTSMSSASTQWNGAGVSAGYFARAGGVQVYAGRLKGRNNRVMCAWLFQHVTMEEPVGVAVTDRKLNRRKPDGEVFGDIWNGYARKIDSFRIMASPGCSVNVKMWTRKNGKNVLLVNVTVWNKIGIKPKFKGFRFLPGFTNKVTKIRTTSLGCPGLDLDYREV